MPKATVPVAKPAGFSKPAGFGRPAGDDDIEDIRKDHPVVLTLLSLAVLLAGYFIYIQYEIDQTPERVTYQEAFFGDPNKESAGASSDASADDAYADDEEDAGDSGDDAPADEDSDDEAPADDEESGGFDDL